MEHMKRIETPLAGAFLLEPPIFSDPRGAFIVTWEKDKLTAFGLDADFIQGNLSVNKSAGTIRGLHAQAEPYGQDKLVRCSRGVIYDVIVDIRPESPTFRQWYGVELRAENALTLYVPRGFLHGYQTLTDDAAVYYQVTTPYNPAAECGARFDDPAFNIRWPHPGEPILSEKDQQWPTFTS